MCQNILTLPVFYEIFPNPNFFSESSFGIYHNEIHILQPGEPQEQHLGEVQQGTLKLKFRLAIILNFE